MLWDTVFRYDPLYLRFDQVLLETAGLIALPPPLNSRLYATNALLTHH
jgi:hypothetical protein